MKRYVSLVTYRWYDKRIRISVHGCRLLSPGPPSLPSDSVPSVAFVYECYSKFVFYSSFSMLVASHEVPYLCFVLLWARGLFGSFSDTSTVLFGYRTAKQSLSKAGASTQWAVNPWSFTRQYRIFISYQGHIGSSVIRKPRYVFVYHINDTYLSGEKDHTRHQSTAMTV